MANDDLKETLSLINQSLRQMSKELIEAGDRQAKELIEAGDRQAKVAERQAKELIEAGERQTKAADRQAKANKKLLDRIEGRETNRMGRIAESVVANVLEWFMKKYFDIEIKHVFREVKIKFKDSAKDSDIDVLAIGEQVIVAVEVKSTINENHVTDFTERVIRGSSNVKIVSNGRNRKIPDLLNKKKKLYGGVAFIGVARDITENEISTVADEHGLFAMKIMGKNSVELCNTDRQLQAKNPLDINNLFSTQCGFIG